MAQAKAQKAVAAASSEGTFRQPVIELAPAAAAAVRSLLQVRSCVPPFSCRLQHAKLQSCRLQAHAPISLDCPHRTWTTCTTRQRQQQACSNTPLQAAAATAATSAAWSSTMLPSTTHFWNMASRCSTCTQPWQRYTLAARQPITSSSMQAISAQAAAVAVPQRAWRQH